MRSVNLPLSGQELPKTCGGWSAGDAPQPTLAPIRLGRVAS